jgi:hypothetical protein
MLATSGRRKRKLLSTIAMNGGMLVSLKLPREIKLLNLSQGGRCTLNYLL